MPSVSLSSLTLTLSLCLSPLLRQTHREGKWNYLPSSLSQSCNTQDWESDGSVLLEVHVPVCFVRMPFSRAICYKYGFFFLALSLCSAVSRYPTNLPPCSPHSPAWVICVRAPLKLLTCRAGLRNSISSPFHYTCTYVHFCKTWAESDGMDITQTVLSFSAFPPSGEGAASCTEYVRSSHFLMAWGTGAILTGFLLMRFPYMWPQNTQSWL